MVLSKEIYSILYYQLAKHFRDVILKPSERLTDKKRPAKLKSESLWSAIRIENNTANYVIASIIGTTNDVTIYYRLLTNYDHKPGKLKYVIGDEQIIDNKLIINALESMGFGESPNYKRLYKLLLEFGDIDGDIDVDQIKAYCLINDMLWKQKLDDLPLDQLQKGYNKISHTFEKPHLLFNERLRLSFDKEYRFIERYYKDDETQKLHLETLNICQLITSYYYHLNNSNFDMCLKFWDQSQQKSKWKNDPVELSKKLFGVSFFDNLSVFDINITFKLDKPQSCICKVFYAEQMVSDGYFDNDLNGNKGAFIHASFHNKAYNKSYNYGRFRFNKDYAFEVARAFDLKFTGDVYRQMFPAEGFRNRLVTMKLKFDSFKWSIVDVINVSIN